MAYRRFWNLLFRLKKNGQFFYWEIAKKFKNDKNIKDTFEFLADEEIEHQKTFEAMLNKLEDYQPPESYPGEYFAYLRAYANEHIFTSKTQREEQLWAVKTKIDALDLGITAEKDSILYYTEMKDFIPTYSQKDLEKITEEERNHFMKLMKLKEQGS